MLSTKDNIRETEKELKRARKAILTLRKSIRRNPAYGYLNKMLDRHESSFDDLTKILEQMKKEEANNVE